MTELNLKCNCNAIQCKITPDIKAIVNCHCNMCRSLSGSAFNSYVVIGENNLTFIQGEDSLSVYSLPVSLGKKYFCKQCGTPLYNTNPKYGPVKIVYLGSISENQQFIPTKNIFCNYKLDWVDGLLNRENLAEGVS